MHEAPIARLDGAHPHRGGASVPLPEREQVDIELVG